MAKLDKKKEEAKTHNEDDVVNRAAAMRNGEQQAGFLKRIFGKKRVMNEQEREQEDTQVHEGATKALTDDLVGIENEGEKQETDTKLTNTEVQQIQEMFDFKEVPKVDGLRNAIAVLVAKDTDAKSTEDAMKKQREFWKNKTNFFA
jgi:predicted ThiF/HesA family dinucleotide-utilizing enzyme